MRVELKGYPPHVDKVIQLTSSHDAAMVVDPAKQSSTDYESVGVGETTGGTVQY